MNFKLNYRQWQKRNTDTFSARTKAQQNQLRNQGYNNRGWVKVKRSWDLLVQTIETLPNSGDDFELGLKRLVRDGEQDMEDMSHIEKMRHRVEIISQIGEYFEETTKL